jgi:hypothetical protein
MAATAVPLQAGAASGRQALCRRSDRIYSFFPYATTPPIAGVFASSVPGANGLAFDEDGNLWTSDGTTDAGARRGGVLCREGWWRDVTEYRVQRTGLHAREGGSW